MDLVEREEFLNELTTAFTEVTAGRGQFVLVSGEAGIGKTSLVETFTASQKQARLLWGACDALLTTRPLGPLYDIAPQAQNNLLSLLEDEAPRASILAAVLEEMDGRTPSAWASRTYSTPNSSLRHQARMEVRMRSRRIDFLWWRRAAIS